MILHWEQIVLHYGKQDDQFIRMHRDKFAKAHQTTYGILYSPICFDDCEITSSGGKHAEEKLLESNSWKIQIPQALSNFHSGYNNSFNVIIGLNRSPCNNCTKLLVNALTSLHKKYPLRATQNRFILASLGAYRPYETERVDNRTTIGNLTALKNAGWELSVLQIGDHLTSYGEMLKSSLESIGFRGICRLER